MTLNLPIDRFKEKILSTVENHPITILTAETGAGKSTRVPLWLYQLGKRVTVTQPRRIAARSLADYVAKINKITLGTQIGYQTGFERKSSRDTRLLYVTDGVQMVREIKKPGRYDVLVIDEIHEWNLNQEVLIGLIKTQLESGRLKQKRLRIVIMSATLLAKQLSRFLGDAPVIEVPGRGFPVTIHHHHPDFLLSDAVEMVNAGKNILVFQPGKKEIASFSRLLEETLKYDKLSAKILALHSEISTKEQSAVFQHYNVPKVVVATDIAQTSITIDDIDSVLDTGLKKEIRTQKGIEGLYITDISQSECRQRAGRAGRVKSGQYILCAESNQSERPDFPEPEIRRLNLESALLRLIKWGIDPLNFVFFHSPKKNLIYQALKRLKIFGALDDENRITEDGNVIAELPVSVKSGRMIIEAMKGGKSVLKEAMKLIAIMEVKGIIARDAEIGQIYEGPFCSDLLNHLQLWNTQKINKKLINYRKLHMAKEIYRELQNRVPFDKAGRKDKLEAPERLISALLSSFADTVFLKALDGSYTLLEEDVERRLENLSILDSIKPDMLVGEPFNLLIQVEDRETGEISKRPLSLISMATAIDLEMLDKLKPFSYHKVSHPIIKKGHLVIENRITFGGRLIAQFESDPDWKSGPLRTEMIPMVIDWINSNLSRFSKLQARFTKIENGFVRVTEVLKGVKPFNSYWNRFLERTLSGGMNTNDLNLFMQLSPDLQYLSAENIVPKWAQKRLAAIGWPKEVKVGDISTRIRYIKGYPYMVLNYTAFELLERQEMVLDSGTRANLILEGKQFNNWDDAVSNYNRWKYNSVFQEKWSDLRKEINVIEDVESVPFPQSFEGGQGKDKEKFIYYTVPEIEGERAYLVHYKVQSEAESAYEKIRIQWAEFIKRFKKRKLDSMFSAKGWIVK